MIRLDQHLVALGFYETRARASDAIARGTISVNGVVAKKAGQKTDPSAKIDIADPAHHYVSRSALKLIKGLDHFGFDPKDKYALDIGASTGGFTQVLLERGASHVTAIDVGHNQLHHTLQDHHQITMMDGINARHLQAQHLTPYPIHIVVSDVSFISLKLALPPALELAEREAFAVLLVKPQFEAGKDAIGKGGLLKDASMGAKIALELAAWLDGLPQWSALEPVKSPIFGSDGNQEYLLGGRKK